MTTPIGYAHWCSNILTCYFWFKAIPNTTYLQANSNMCKMEGIAPRYIKFIAMAGTNSQHKVGIMHDYYVGSATDKTTYINIDNNFPFDNSINLDYGIVCHFATVCTLL